MCTTIEKYFLGDKECISEDFFYRETMEEIGTKKTNSWSESPKKKFLGSETMTITEKKQFCGRYREYR